MSTATPDLWAALSAPFENHEVKMRQGGGGRQLHYITARTAMNRLDMVLGPENWWDAYEVMRDNSTLCKLTVRLPDGQTVTKQGIGVTSSSVGEDAEKGGESDALKRAAAKFGVARYLYRDGVPNFGGEAPPAPAPAQGRAPQGSPRGAPLARNGHADDRSNGYAPPDGQQQPQGDRDPYRCPRSGKGLFAWVKDMEGRHRVGLLRFLNDWAKLQEFPSRMIDWSEEEVRLGHEEAMRKIRTALPPVPETNGHGGHTAPDGAWVADGESDAPY